MAAILVIDPSPFARETLRIVLGPEHDVAVAPCWDDARAGAYRLVICGGPIDGAAAAVHRVRIAPDVPVLLLHAADAVDAAALAPADEIAFLPQPFDPRTLRVRVRALLTTRRTPAPSDPTVARHRRMLEHPFVPREVATLARRAALAPMPVLLIGEHGTGAPDVARAIHFFGGGGTPLEMRNARAPRLASGVAAGGAIVLEDVHLLSHDDQARLLTILRQRGPLGPRIFATTDADLDECVATGALSVELAYALDVVRLVLPPLRDRLDDVPELVMAMVAELVEHLRLEPVHVAEAALARLQRYLWLGNLAELDNVLARTLAVHRPRVLEPEMLLLAPESAPVTTDALDTRGEPGPPSDAPAARARGGEASGLAAPAAADATPPLVAAPAPTTAPLPARGRVLPLERRRIDDPAVDLSPARSPAVAPAGPTLDAGAAGSTTAPSLEILLGELAHELRNPMVTIKTFAQHLDSVMEDPEVRARFAALTGDAISRMDALLETLLDFSRFRAPVPQPLDLAALLARALDERADDLARKEVRLEHTAADAAPPPVAGDEAQVLFALRSLVEGLLRDLVPHAPLRIRVRDDGGVELAAHADRAVAARLAAYVADAEGRSDAAVPPLPFALAAALLRRNSGRVETRAGDDGTTMITVTLPRASAEGR